MSQSRQHEGFWIEADLLVHRFGIHADVLAAAVQSETVRTRIEDDVILYAVADLDAWLRAQPKSVGSLTLRATIESDAVQLKLQRANHLAQMGTMAMSVGHEINNPLTYVISNNEYICTDILPRLQALQQRHPEMQALLSELTMLHEEIEEGAEHIRRVVAELGGLRRPATETSLVLPIDAVQAALRMASPALNSSVSLTHHVMSSRPIRINISLLVQVLINLLTNAAHAVQGMLDPRIEVHCVEASGSAIIEVRDNGSGIRSELLDRIFDPFFTTKPAGEGTGLGLSVCRKLVEDMSGTMTLSSTLQQGTTVRVIIPLAKQLFATTDSSVDLSIIHGLRILIVDDQPSVLRSVMRMLAPLGLDITTEDSPRRALKLIKDSDYDMILSDLMMPSMTGMALYQEVMQHKSEKCSRFLFMSGGPSSEEARAFCTAHADRLLTKPINYAMLTRALVSNHLQPVEHAEPCPNINRCPMFPKFQSDRMLNIYKVIYCEPTDGAHHQCSRYQSMRAGVRPSPRLLPNGEELPE
ncbi:MAG: ATP-binding protein [Myxococcota bacterium]|nr:ATP-binding protein [Myxococcota bacterium]